MMKRQLSEPHLSAKSKQFQPKDLPSNEQIRTVYEESDENEKIWLCLLVMSGRRGIDISRLKWKDTQLFEEEMTCVLERDKASKGSPVSFVCKWEDLDVPGIERKPVEKWLRTKKKSSNKSDYVIKMGENLEASRQKQFILFKQKISRRCAFCIHGLRRRRAVTELINGKNQERVSSKIGWKSKNSIFTYISLSSDQIKDFKNYSTFQIFMNDQHLNRN